MSELEKKLVEETELITLQDIVGVGRVIDMVGALLMNPHSRLVLGEKVLVELKKICLSYRFEQKSE